MSSRIIESLYRISGIELTEATRSKKLDSSYYKVAKQILKSITGVSSSVMEEVSSREKDFFDPNKVVISLETRYKTYESNLKKMAAAKYKIESTFNGSTVQFDKYGRIFISIPKEEIESLDEFKQLTAKPEHDSISFWATTVFDYRNTAIAYGAKIKAIDGFEFPTRTDIKRIQTKLGERRFHEFSKGDTQYFKTYDALVKFIKYHDRYVTIDELPSEQDLIESAWEERYYTR